MAYEKWVDTATLQLWVDPATGAGYAYLWPAAGTDPTYGDGHITGASTTYATARATSTGSTYTDNQSVAVGQLRSGSTRTVVRAVLPFDTTFLGAGTTVTTATLTLTPSNKVNVGTNFNVYVRLSAATTLWATTNRESHYDTILANSNLADLGSTSGMSVNVAITSGDLGAASISKTAWTNVALISSRDVGANDPSGNEAINFYDVAQTTSAYRPMLTVNFTGLTATGAVYVGQAAVEVAYTTSQTANVLVGQAAVEAVYTTAQTANVLVGQAAVETSFLFESPTITGVSPANGAIGDQITLSGTRFHSSQGTGSVKLNGTTCTIVSWSDTEIVFTVPIQNVGPLSLVVTNEWGKSASTTLTHDGGVAIFYDDGAVLTQRSTWTFGDTVYAEARDATIAYGYGYLAAMLVGQQWDGTYKYSIRRAWMRFDTTNIGSAANISEVKVSLTAIGDSSGVDFDVLIVHQDWANLVETVWNAVQTSDLDGGIWRNTSGLALNTPYWSEALDTDWVNKTGVTKYALQSSRDRDATTPTGGEHIQFARWDNATVAYRPILSVTYSGEVPTAEGYGVLGMAVAGVQLSRKVGVGTAIAGAEVGVGAIPGPKIGIGRGIMDVLAAGSANASKSGIGAAIASAIGDVASSARKLSRGSAATGVDSAPTSGYQKTGIGRGTSAIDAGSSSAEWEKLGQGGAIAAAPTGEAIASSKSTSGSASTGIGIDAGAIGSKRSWWSTASAIGADLRTSGLRWTRVRSGNTSTEAFGTKRLDTFANAGRRLLSLLSSGKTTLRFRPQTADGKRKTKNADDGKRKVDDE